MTNPTSNHKLSTPVYKHLNGVESWESADKDTRIAFYGAMKGRAYGREPTLDAWNWFLIGRAGRPADETTAKCPHCGGSNYIKALDCTHCGKPTMQPEEPTAVLDRNRDERFVGRELAPEKASGECQHDRFKPNPTLTWMGSTPDITKTTHRYRCKVCQGSFDLEPGIAQVSGHARSQDQAAAQENGNS